MDFMLTVPWEISATEGFDSSNGSFFNNGSFEFTLCAPASAFVQINLSSFWVLQPLPPADDVQLVSSEALCGIASVTVNGKVETFDRPYPMTVARNGLTGVSFIYEAQYCYVQGTINIFGWSSVFDQTWPVSEEGVG